MLVNTQPWVLKNDEKFSRRKSNSIYTAQMAFRSIGKQKIFQKRITQQGIVEEDIKWSGGLFYLQENLTFNLSVVDKM